ncbi:MAG: hypothetical protein M1546_13630 [Chloroflexi bacterium]|nr:hypothetical protein [Chloroflexota bacterium]
MAPVTAEGVQAGWERANERIRRQNDERAARLKALQEALRAVSEDVYQATYEHLRALARTFPHLLGSEYELDALWQALKTTDASAAQKLCIYHPQYADSLRRLSMACPCCGWAGGRNE